MAEAQEERGTIVRDLPPPPRKGQTTEPQPNEQAARVRFEALRPEHMPQDYAISLDAYRRGGTDRFIGKAPEGLVSHPLRGFPDPAEAKNPCGIGQVIRRVAPP
jgi:hypothetical protein